MRQWEIKRPQVPVSFLLPTGIVPVILRPSAYPITLDQYVPAMFVPFAEQSPDFARAIVRGEISEYIPAVVEPVEPVVAPEVKSESPPIVVDAPLETHIKLDEAPAQVKSESTPAEEESSLDNAEPTLVASTVELTALSEKPDQSWSIEQLTVYLRDNQIQAPQSMKKPAILRAIANHSVQE